MPENDEGSSSTDIFQLLEETTEKEEKKKREELLAPLDIQEFFEEGSISIDKRTCQGLECKLCIDVCPTNALYWKAGEVGITPELCVYCGACVLSCMIDDCIKIERKRPTGEVESFSNPREFIMLQKCINTDKRRKRTQDLLLRE
ncbi:MAG: 4Fe-4S dicluster domain-containing protein [Thermoproteota archaeon]